MSGNASSFESIRRSAIVQQQAVLQFCSFRDPHHAERLEELRDLIRKLQYSIAPRDLLKVDVYIRSRNGNIPRWELPKSAHLTHLASNDRLPLNSESGASGSYVSL